MFKCLSSFFLIVGAYHDMVANPGLYNELVNIASTTKSISHDEIERDLHRSIFKLIWKIIVPMYP